MNLQMPAYKHDVRVLVVGDALEPEPVEEEALSTEAGFARQMELKEEFLQMVEKLIQMDIGLIVVDRGVDPVAEEMLTDAGVMVVQRVSQRDLTQVADHTGARIVKRSALRKLPEELETVIGHCGEVEDHEPYQRMRVSEGRGKPFATILVGASTEEVVGERERICKDAASAVQAAVRGGFLPGRRCRRIGPGPGSGKIPGFGSGHGAVRCGRRGRGSASSDGSSGGECRFQSPRKGGGREGAPVEAAVRFPRDRL